MKTKKQKASALEIKQIEKTLDSFKSQNLKKLKIKYEGDPALLIIDVQKEFCDPEGFRGSEKTKEVSKRIQSIVPAFRKAHIPVYVIYFSRDGDKNVFEIDFYEFKPEKNDILISKNRDSAFQGSNIKEILNKHKRKTLLTCGFNLSACVFRTIQDARSEGFDVCLLEDLSEDDKFNSGSGENSLRKMRDIDVEIKSSQDVLKNLRPKNNKDKKIKVSA